jgi:ribosomal protein L4
MAAARPLVTVQGLDGVAGEQAPLPAVFTAPIRPDIVRTVHTNIAKNKRRGGLARAVEGGGGVARGRERPAHRARKYAAASPRRPLPGPAPSACGAAAASPRPLRSAPAPPRPAGSRTRSA